jgi:uncharacterized protein (TIGR00369 family)
LPKREQPTAKSERRTPKKERQEPLAIAPPANAAEARVRASFAKQAFMKLLGATLSRVAPGEVDVALPFRDDLVQQHGYLHAGVTAAIADSACGYAALTLMPPHAAVLSVEYKVNMLAPAKGRRFLALGRVVRSGGTVTVVRGEVLAFDERDHAAPVLLMQGTMLTARNRGIVD